MGAKRVVSLLFSGGSDSTLAAALLARDFDEIHLCTFKHYATWNIGASRIHARRLQEKFGDKRFIHVFLNSSAFFVSLQKDIFGDWASHPYLTNYFCGACKLAMHSQLIIYNIKNGIGHAASGASALMAMFPDQNKEGSDVLRDFYASYGITYHVPVYGADGVDKKLVESGIMDSRHLKDNHKARNPVEFLYVPFLNVFGNIQGFCLHIFLVDVYHCLFRKKTLDVQGTVDKHAGRYYSSKIEAVCRTVIDKAVKG